MGRITTSIGLITGIPITDTVDQLIQVAARPKDLIVAQTQIFESKQIAVSELTARLLGVQFGFQGLSNESLFDRVQVESSNDSLLSVRQNGEPAKGIFQLTPVRQAREQQMLSSGFASIDKPIGSGSLSFRFGRAVDEAVDLELLNGSAGVQRGKIRITDRSGASEEIDLRFARTVDDVLEKINAASQINISAEVQGDSLRLIDHTGQSTSNLFVQEVGIGSTAADLGLLSINVAANQADGADVLSLGENTTLAQLNDGLGVSIDDALPDFAVRLRDETTIFVDFHQLKSESGNAFAVTNAANGIDAQVRLTAVKKGEEFDDVKIVFQDDPSVIVGNETVVFDESDPENKRLVFRIDTGDTTAADIVAAVSGNSAVSALFTAQLENGSDGTGAIDLADSDVSRGGGPREAGTESTLGEIVATINEASPDKLRVEILGDRLVLTDLSEDKGAEFKVEASFESSTFLNLGLDVKSVDGVINGRRLLGGLKTSLLSSLNGGKGFGKLGSVHLVDRAGIAADVDLSGAQSLSDVVNAINGAGTGVKAQINVARNGLALIDETGASTLNLIVSSAGDGFDTAEKLGLVVDAATDRHNGGDLDLQIVSENTKLDDLNGGQGVSRGRIRIVDSASVSNSVDLGQLGLETVGDLIGAINSLATGIDARINDSGDGIVLIDTAGGASNPRVFDIVGTAARDLKLNRDATEVTIDGRTRKVVDGSQALTVEFDNETSLSGLIEQINELGVGVSATILNDGSADNPFRFTLVSSQTGRLGAVHLDASSAGFDVEETVKAEDALLLFGDPNSVGAGVLASSSTNTFEDLVGGLSLTINQASLDVIGVRVRRDTSGVSVAAGAFVDAYNTMREKYEELTAFDPNSFRTGVLFGSGEALRVDTDLARFITGRVFGAGSIQSLVQIGFRLNSKGRMTFDASKLNEQLASNPDRVKEFLTKEDAGVGDRFHALLETLIGVENSLMGNRLESLATKIELNRDRIQFFSDRLEAQREQLLEQFVRMELTIGKLQNNLNALGQVQAFTPLTGPPSSVNIGR